MKSISSFFLCIVICHPIRVCCLWIRSSIISNYIFLCCSWIINLILFNLFIYPVDRWCVFLKHFGWKFSSENIKSIIKNYYYWFNLLICSNFTFSRDCRLHLSLFALLLFVQAPSISSSVHLRFRSWISLIILNTSALEMRLSESILPAKSEVSKIHQKGQALSL